MFNNWFDRKTKILTTNKKYKAYGAQIETRVYRVNWDWETHRERALRCKYEDLSLDPQHTHVKPGTAMTHT